MVCHYCGSDTNVVNSRLQKRANRVWRRRHCPACGSTVTTLESIDFTASISFRPVSGSLEPFQRDVLFVSVLDSLRHRKTAVADATALTETILRSVRACMDDAGAIKRELLVSTVTTTLQRFDHVAGVQYQAFHPIKRLS